MPSAIGLTCGIGSMLIGARQAGFDIVGNIEWRPYYDTGTWQLNFPDAFYVRSIDDLDKIPKDIDLAMGHPDCGNFSILSMGSVKSIKKRQQNPGDIPLFVQLVADVKPRYFVMDNLGPALGAYTMKQWVFVLNEYDLYPEWVSNYHYGNPQKNRRRFFMVGSHKKEKFIFQPGEQNLKVTVADCIADLPLQCDLPKINHVHVNPGDSCRWTAPDEYRVMDFDECAKVMLAIKPGKNPIYMNKKGESKVKPGRYRVNWDKHAHVVTGGFIGVKNFAIWDLFHNKTGYPLTIRERARLQGCPDDFIFKGIDEELVRQTGKFMPIQFCRYISEQILAHIEGEQFECSGQRLVKPNEYVDEAKQWYCKEVGYDCQDVVCEQCWMKKSCPLCKTSRVFF